MYSKREVCFTVIAALAISWHVGPQTVMPKAEDQGIAGSFGDGTHPPPPPWLMNTDMLEADGTHPPPPPPTPPQSQLGNAEILQADGTHPPPPPPPPPSLLVNTAILQADGTHPPPPPWFANETEAG